MEGRCIRCLKNHHCLEGSLTTVEKQTLGTSCFSRCSVTEASTATVHLPIMPYRATMFLSTISLSGHLLSPIIFPWPQAPVTWGCVFLLEIQRRIPSPRLGWSLLLTLCVTPVFLTWFFCRLLGTEGLEWDSQAGGQGSHDDSVTHPILPCNWQPVSPAKDGFLYLPILHCPL